MDGRGIASHLLWRSSAGVIALVLASPAFAQQAARTTPMAGQPMASALQQLAVQTGLNIIFKTEDVAPLRAPATAGGLTPRAALSRILDGTGLEPVETAPGAFIVRKRSAPPQPLLRPEPEMTVVDDLTVTGQKRVERAQDVPIFATVVTADQISDRQINTVADVARLAPSLTFGTPGEASPGGGAVIRGIGTVAFSRSASPSVGIVVDGVPTGGVNIANLFDVEQIEVLSGPQGTLFGDSVSAGLINIRTNAPKLGVFEARVSADVAADGLGGSRIANRTVRGMVNAPISPALALRLSAYGLSVKGPDRNLVTGARSGDEESGFRARLRWRPSERLQVNLTVDDNLTRTRDDFSTYSSVVPGSILATALSQCGVTPSVRNFTSCGSSPTRASIENRGVSAEVAWSVGALDVAYLGGYRRQDTLILADIDGLPAGLGSLQVASGPERHPAQYLTQEVHVASPSGARFNYVAGFFYGQFTGHHEQPSLAAMVLPPGTLTPRFQSTDTSKHDLALFGQSNYGLTSHLTLVTGARLNWSALEDTHKEGAVAQSVSARFNNLSWRLGLEYRPDRDRMYYATVTRGYKGPQANDISTKAAPSIIYPELPLYLELGSKLIDRGRGLVVNYDVYLADIVNFQGQYCPPPAINQLPSSCQPDNITSVKIYGFEASARWRLAENLSFQAGAIYNVARYPNGYLAADGTDLSNKQLVFAPLFKSTLSADYNRRLGNGLQFFMTGDAVYTSATRQAVSGDPLLVYPSHWIAGARAGLRGDAWSVTLYGRNLADVAEPLALSRSLTQTGDPAPDGYWRLFRSRSRREVGLSLSRDF